jgi:hypothetical protein
MVNCGVPISKDELFVAYEPTMLQCQRPHEVLVKMTLYTPGETCAKDSFANELTIYERLGRHPHHGICKYKGRVVQDGYVEGLVLAVPV